MKHFLAGAILTAVSIASAITGRDDVPPQDFNDLGAAYGSVGKLDGSFDGSGVLISDQWLLTSAHVAALSSNMTFTVGGTEYDSAEIIIHPGYTLFDSSYANDIALVRLESSVTSVEPATLYRFGALNAVLGMDATWVGHGLSGNGTTGD
ncbi:MAG: trypsin-like serine protease, partial [Puniceicoccales bacterium]